MSTWYQKRYLIARQKLIFICKVLAGFGPYSYSVEPSASQLSCAVCCCRCRFSPSSSSIPLILIYSSHPRNSYSRPQPLPAHLSIILSSYSASTATTDYTTLSSAHLSSVSLSSSASSSAFVPVHDPPLPVLRQFLQRHPARRLRFGCIIGVSPSTATRYEVVEGKKATVNFVDL